MGNYLVTLGFTKKFLEGIFAIKIRCAANV